MNKLQKRVTVMFAVFMVFVIGIIYAITIGTINLPWDVVSAPVTMSPTTINVPIGTVVVGDIASQVPTDSLSDLIVNVATVVDVNLGGAYGGFSSISVTVDLYSGGLSVYTATVTDFDNLDSFGTVAVGTYDIYVSFSATASSVGTGTATVTLDY